MSLRSVDGGLAAMTPHKGAICGNGRSFSVVGERGPYLVEHVLGIPEASTVGKDRIHLTSVGVKLMVDPVSGGRVEPVPA